MGVGVSDHDYTKEITVSKRIVSTFIFGTAELGFQHKIHVK